jgi:hypothetical protein
MERQTNSIRSTLHGGNVLLSKLALDIFEVDSVPAFGHLAINSLEKCQLSSLFSDVERVAILEDRSGGTLRLKHYYVC